MCEEEKAREKREKQKGEKKRKERERERERERECVCVCVERGRNTQALISLNKHCGRLTSLSGSKTNYQHPKKTFRARPNK